MTDAPRSRVKEYWSDVVTLAFMAGEGFVFGATCAILLRQVIEWSLR